MEEVVGGDVKVEGTSPSTDSSPVQTGSDTVQESQPPAEALKTEQVDPELEGVDPSELKTKKGLYERFKQVNEERKKLKETYSSVSNEELEALKALKTSLQEDPALEAALVEAIKQHQQKKSSPKQDELAQYAPEVADRLRKVDSIDREIQVERRQNNYERILNSFDKNLADHKIAAEDRSVYYDYFESALYKVSRDPLARFTQQDVDKAFKMAHEQLDGFSKRRLAKYVPQKKEDQMPSTSKSGVPVSTEKSIKTEADRVAFATEFLKAAMSS